MDNRLNLDEELIGQGAFGKVYKKYDSESQQVVAIKKIEIDLMDSPDYEKVGLLTIRCKLTTRFTSVAYMRCA